MKKYLLFLFYIGFSISIFAQALNPQVIASGGAAGNSLNYWLNFTLGQTVVGNGASTNYVLTQGFHQTGLNPPPDLLDCESPDGLPAYNIGEIANQTAYGGVPLAFYICSEELGTRAKQSIQILAPQPSGSVQFNPNNSKFSFTPSATDRGNYTIIFRAVAGQDTVYQEVIFNVIPFLQPEQTAFGLEPSRALPKADDDDYIIVTESKGAVENFNHASRQTVNFSIAGKTLIFDKNIVNKVQKFSLNVRNDIKSLNIYAETVIIRSALEFPQTNVTIHARHLSFEDAGNVFASINTKPLNANPDPTQNAGVNGLQAGNITLHIQNLRSNPGNRFRLIGGKGQGSSNAKSGDGGNGGVLSSTLDVSSFADLVGGEAGGGPQSGNKGNAGNYSTINKKHSWLHPYALKMVVAHAKAAYLNGYMNFTQQIFDDYITQVDAYKQSSEWSAIAQEDQFELDQLQQETGTVLHRIGSNLDYFGNPAGWVPMLSFEVNKLAFEQEIDRAIRILYFCYWVQRSTANNDQKLTALQDAKKQQQQLLIDFQNNYNAAVILLPQLEAEADAIISEMENIQDELEKLENELTERARYLVEERHKPPKSSWWRKVVRTVGTIAQVVPLYQPALGAIGGGLVAISEIDFKDPLSIIKNGTNAVKSFKMADFEASTANFKAQMTALNPTQLDVTSPAQLRQYYESLSSTAKPIYDAVKDLRQKVGETKVPLEEIQVELEKMKAESPEFTELINKANDLMTQKAQFEQKITVTLQSIASLTNNIQNGVLSVDGMNLQIFEVDSKRDLRAMIYVKDMERRAKERLIKYHYYMAKAYEYRLVEAYTPELNLPALFDRFKNIVENEDTNVLLTPEEFNRIRAIYDEVISTVTDNILTIYNQNAPEVSAPIRFDFTKEDLDLLNAGQAVNLNMVERGMFPPYEENIRILGFKIVEVESHFEGGNPGSFAYFDILMEHSGISRLKKDGQVYLFNHYNNQNRNPIVWGIRYDASDGLVQPKEPSASTESLLKSILDSLGKGTNENLILYSRPAAWADIIVTKNDRTSNGVKMVIDKLRCEVTYDFQQLSTNLASVNVVTNNGMKPYIHVSRADKNERQDGWGSFTRTYFKNPNSNVLLNAPAWYGTWQFEKWTDAFGTTLGINTTLPVNLGADRMVKANYKLIQPALSVATDTINLSGDPGQQSVLVQNIAEGEMNWTASGNSDWLQLNDDSIGVNDQTFSFSYKENNTGSVRETKLVVIAPSSIDYIDTIVVIQAPKTTGTIEEYEQDKVRIYPNPSIGELHIQADASYLNGQIFIYNSLGILVQLKRINSEKMVFDLSSLAKGVYFIEIRTVKKNITKKIILK